MSKGDDALGASGMCTKGSICQPKPGSSDAWAVAPRPLAQPVGMRRTVVG